APATTKPWTRWWWPGSAVDEAGLTRQLEQFAAAGLGGVEITPIYGVRGADDRNVPFLSPRWMELLAHTGREAQRLGLGVDMATGTGWPFGGPWVAVEDGSQKLVLQDGRLAGAPTRMKVKRAAPGAEGLVVDPYSPAALNRYLAPFTDAFAGFPRGLVRGQFHDSFEYYESGWTPGLPAAFQAMHGYDLQDHATELVSQGKLSEDDIARLKGDFDAALPRLKADYRATLGKLHLDYLREWIRWSHEHGFIVRNQSHGAPANLLDLYGAVDIPETETFGSTPFPIPGLRREWTSNRDLPDPLVLRMASSAAHVMGRPLASSETCTWLREHWQVALSFTKPEIDRLFTTGINHLLYHGTVFSPPDATWPGWLFYASTQFHPQNTWWTDFAALNAYITRVQSVLQSGRPDNDVLVYWPFHDVLHAPDGLMKQYGVHDRSWLTGSAFERTTTELLHAGYGVDYISDDQLLHCRGDNGAVVTPGGGRYHALIVPLALHMPVETLAQLRELVRQGATVLLPDGTPADVPGLGRLEERRAQLRELAAAPELQHSLGLFTTLANRQVPREPAVEAGLEFIRRARDGGRDYFFTNLGERHFDGWLKLGTAARAATLTDPLTGRSGGAPLRPGAMPQVYLQLAPGESVLLRTFETVPGDLGAPWTWTKPAGEPVPLAGNWSIKFLTGGPALPPATTTAQLKSWTELGGEAVQNFSGTARYRLEFDLPAAAADDWLLDLGDVRESARVRLNGAEVATAWSLPFRLRVGAHLKRGRNVIELDVTNLAANRIRDLDRRKVDWKIMREINFVNIDYKPFDASGWPTTPSGLLGPVTLTPLRQLALP
ncbi:MAG TPA: glycosyl hydrolase, partial [Lacunisphaera sp.]|nr:glycosyl hydrolase [Lacunisphaera sp.]